MKKKEASESIHGLGSRVALGAIAAISTSALPLGIKPIGDLKDSGGVGGLTKVHETTISYGVKQGKEKHDIVDAPAQIMYGQLGAPPPPPILGRKGFF